MNLTSNERKETFTAGEITPLLHPEKYAIEDLKERYGLTSALFSIAFNPTVDAFNLCLSILATAQSSNSSESKQERDHQKTDYGTFETITLKR